MTCFRNFLRPLSVAGLPGGSGVLPHSSVQDGGAGWLTANNSDGRFDFQGVPGTSLRIMAWAMLQAKPVASGATIAGVADGLSLAGESWVLQYNGFADRWEIYKSNGTAFASLQGTISPALNTWYGLAATLNYNSLSLDVYTLAGLLESRSVGLADNGFNAGGRPLGVGARTAGNQILTGRIDSLSVSYSPFGNPAPGPVLFHGGKAPDWGELTPADHVALETIKLWADFGERSGAPSYHDSSNQGSTLFRSGTGLTRQPGAGY